MFFIYSLANTDLFERGVDAARSVTESWDKVWTDTLGDGTYTGTLLYGVLCDLAVVFAVGTLVFFGIKIFHDLNNNNLDGLSQLIWPFIVVLLLANDGALLSSVTLEVREVINQVNQELIEITTAGAKLDELYRQAQGMGNIQGVISGYMSQCEGFTGEKQIQCLNTAIDQSETLVDGYRQVYGGGGWLDAIFDRLDSIRKAISENPMSVLDPTKNPIYWGLLGPAWEQIAYGILWAWQSAFQTGVEVSFLLTATVGPLAVGGSLLPYGTKPIFAWVTGFFSVGMLKLSFNIIAGLAAAMFVQADNTDALPFPIFLAIFAPLLAGAIAFGGGIAVWTSITGAASSIVRIAARSI